MMDPLTMFQQNLLPGLPQHEVCTMITRSLNQQPVVALHGTIHHLVNRPGQLLTRLSVASVISHHDLNLTYPDMVVALETGVAVSALHHQMASKIPGKRFSPQWNLTPSFPALTAPSLPQAQANRRTSLVIPCNPKAQASHQQQHPLNTFLPDQLAPLGHILAQLKWT